MLDNCGDLLSDPNPIEAYRYDRKEVEALSDRVLDGLKGAFAPRDLLLWQAGLLTGIGCADALISIGERLLATALSD